jgi:pSer/pThr/pTyr-binding forkhead associated (FHA) protein
MAEQEGFLDFEINVSRIGAGEYNVRAGALGGRAEARFTDPFTEDKRTIIRQTLTTASLRHSARVRSSSAPEVKVMKEFGSTLFTQILPDQVRQLYYQCLGTANEQGKGLRIRLVLDPAVDDLPWEFLCTPEREFMGLDPKTPIVRFIEVPTPVAPLKAELPLRVLIVIASPGDQIPLDVAKEKQRITSALQALEEQSLVKLTFLEGPETWSRLIDALRPNETHILHFIGHGMFDEARQEGVLIMETESGESYFVGSDLMRILVQGKSRLRLVVLNSCLGTQAAEAEPLSSVAASLVRAGVPAVIAMQFEVSDDAAQTISSAFYKALALNFPVDAALTEARREIALLHPESLEWATPILFMQVPDGQLFRFTPLEAAAKLGLHNTVPFKFPATVITQKRPEQTRLVRADTQEEFVLTQDLTSIGRNPDNYCVIADPSVSRYHALIRREGTAYIVNDLGGPNGTLINGQRIATPTELQADNLIRFGNVEFQFELAGASGERPPVTEPDLNDRAAEKYKAGEEAALRGDWAAAVQGYQGALMFVPNYQDAAQKMANCQRRYECVKSYELARRQYGDQNYAQALDTLAQLRKTDPKWSDTAEVQVLSECGLQYQEALLALQANDRVRGAELLRAVVSRRPNFQDAASRLQHLADGGDGLSPFETLPPPPVGLTSGTGAPTPSASPGFKIYELPNANLKQLIEEIRQFLLTKSFETQVLQQGTAWVVQGQKGGWRRLVGMSVAATVILEATESGYKASVGGGRWLEQGAAIAVSMVVMWPLLITGGAGMIENKMILDKLTQIVDNYAASRGGRRVA